MKIEVDIDGDGIPDIEANLDAAKIRKLLMIKLAAATGAGALICEFLLF